MNKIEINPTTMKTVINALNRWASGTNAIAETLWNSGLQSREEAKPYVRAWALQRNPLEVLDKHGKPVTDKHGKPVLNPWRKSAAERAFYRALDVFWPATSAKAESARKGAKDRHASVKVNKALVARIVAELAGMTQAEVRATLAAVRDGITFE